MAGIVTKKQLVPPQQVPTTESALYTCPPNTTAVIGKAIFTNNTGAAATITVGISNSGNALTAAQTITPAISVAAHSVYIASELGGAAIPGGGQIRALAGTGSAITALVSGVEIS